MNRKIEDYMIVVNKSDFYLSKEIKRWMEEYNYELLGQPFWNGHEYCQALVKYNN